MTVKMKMYKPRGAFEFQVINEDGSIEQQSDGEIKNLILDSFLGHHKNSNASHNFQLAIGSGVQTEPKKTDTSLGNQVAISGFFAIPASPANTGAYDHKDGIVRIFTEVRDFTGINGMITELGIVKAGLLLTKALIKDENQNPVAIPLTNTQTLRITYRLYVYYPAVAAEGVWQTDLGEIPYKVCLSSELANPVDPKSVRCQFYMYGFVNSISSYMGNNSVSVTLIASPTENKFTASAGIDHSPSERNLYIEVRGSDVIAGSSFPYAWYYIIVYGKPKIPPNTTVRYTLEFELDWIDDEVVAG